MNKNNSNNTTIVSNVEGLILKGSVAGRKKRNVGAKNIELVTYKIFADGKAYFVKDWAPKDYLSVGSPVELPITVKSHQNNGQVLIDYTVCTNSNFGDDF